MGTTPVEKMWKADLQSELKEAREELQRVRNLKEVIKELLNILGEGKLIALIKWGKISTLSRTIKENLEA